jgi:hypothetical protein
MEEEERRRRGRDRLLGLRADDREDLLRRGRQEPDERRLNALGEVLRRGVLVRLHDLCREARVPLKKKRDVVARDGLGAELPRQIREREAEAPHRGARALDEGLGGRVRPLRGGGEALCGVAIAEEDAHGDLLPELSAEPHADEAVVAGEDVIERRRGVEPHDRRADRRRRARGREPLEVERAPDLVGAAEAEDARLEVRDRARVGRTRVEVRGDDLPDRDPLDAVAVAPALGVVDRLRRARVGLAADPGPDRRKLRRALALGRTERSSDFP